MELFLQAIKTGFLKALKTTATLMKVVLPVYALVVLIKHSPILDFLEGLFQPAMSLFNLPGEAVVPLITGIFTDEYGAIATASQFPFTTAELTTIAMMGLVFHSIPVEFALTQRIGLPAGKFVLYRFGMAIVVGLIVAWIGGMVL